MLIAMTREISRSITRCELTHVPRQPIDFDRARAQHEAYEVCLREAGCAVVRLGAQGDMPDSVFIEDIAVVFDEVGVITRPGATSRRVETPGVADAIGTFRPLRYIEPPGTLDGGDVLVVGRRVFIGESLRTNKHGISQMAAILAPYGHRVTPVAVHGCLHLKSAVTAVSDNTLLVNRQWVAVDQLEPFELIDVDPSERAAANALWIGDRVVYPLFPRTRARLEARGLHVVAVDVSELAKAEGGVTCCSLIFSYTSGPNSLHAAGARRH